jgi:hypothetical protein
LALEDRVLFVALGEVDEELRLEAAVDVLGDVKGAGVVVHGGAEAKARIGVDLDPSDDRLDVAATIEERREAGPALLAHAVAFVEHADAAGDHGGDEGLAT